MALVAMLLVGIVALLHVYFLILEMFLWKKPRTRAIFGTDADFAVKSKVLAGNQGLYNGFLAAGLFWGLFLGATGQGVTMFFLICVLTAGVYGGLTASRKILIYQALPAALGILAVLLS